jgi:Tfp pilus assembly protein PilN
MPLPQQVIEQLNREPETPQGWAAGAVLFSVGILVLLAVIYFGMKFGYEPYLTNQVSQAQNQAIKAGQSISVGDEQQIISFYSQIANLKAALANHVYSSQFLVWLENNTEANVYYQSLDLSSGTRVSIKGIAATEADVNQQIAIFESSSKVTSVVVSSIAAAQSPAKGLEFDVTLTMNPSVFTSGGAL